MSCAWKSQLGRADEPDCGDWDSDYTDSYDSEYDSEFDDDGRCDCPFCSSHRSSLMCLLEYGDQFQVKKLIQSSGFDVNAVVQDDETPLMVACRFGHMNLIDMLIKDLEASVDHGNEEGRTALMRAAFCKQVKTVNTLINKYKANVDAEDVWGATALFYAIQEGHLDVVNALAGTHKADVEHGRSNGERPLMAAALQGSTDIVNLLCSRHKVDVNGTNNRGQTALMYACEEGNVDVVHALVARHKAKIDVRCDDGLMALHYAAMYGKHNIVDILVGKFGADIEAVTTEDKWTALHYAVDCGSLATVKVLVNKYDANTKAVDEFGATPLAFAKGDSNQDIVKVLLDESFVVYVKAVHPVGKVHDAGRTDANRDEVALEKECKGKLQESGGKDGKVEVKLRINASTKAQRVIDVFCDKKGWRSGDVVFSYNGGILSVTPDTTIADLGLKRNDCIHASLDVSLEDLHAAIRDDDIDEIKRITDLNAFDLNAREKGGSGPTGVMLAILNDKVRALRVLLDAGADVEATNEDGWTPLIVAAASNRPEIIRILIQEYSARLESRDLKKGWTAVFHAISVDSLEVVELLIENGASVTAKDKDGETPLDHARKRENEKIIDVLKAIKPAPLGHTSPDNVEGKPEDCDSPKKVKGGNLAKKLAAEEEATRRKFAEEIRKRAAEEEEQSRLRAVNEEAQRKAAAEEKARIEAIKARKRAEDEAMRKKLEEEEAALHKRHMAEKKAREKEEKALRKQRKKEAEQEAKVKLKALAEEKKEEQMNEKVKAGSRSGRPRVLVRPAGRPAPTGSFDTSDPVEALIKYAEEGNMLNVTSLINHQNVDVNARHPKTGITAVMAAARMGRASTVKSLVKKFAKIEATDFKGRTALMHAIMGNQPGMVKELLEAFRADVSVVDEDGNTPLSLAEDLGMNGIKELLILEMEKAARIQNRGKPESSKGPLALMSGGSANRVEKPVEKPVETKIDRNDHLNHIAPNTDLTAGSNNYVLAEHHIGAMCTASDGFFGGLSGGPLNGLNEALEDGLEAPPEEMALSKDGLGLDPIASGRTEWLKNSLFSADGGPNNVTGREVDGVMEDLLKDIDLEISEANEINLVAEDVPLPLPYSNVGLGGLLTSAPVPGPPAPDPGSHFFERFDGSGLFDPIIPNANKLQPQHAPVPREPAPVTAQEIESRLRRPPGFDHSPVKSLMDGRRHTADDREQKWEKKFEAMRRERDELRKQLKRHAKRLAEGEKRMKSMEDLLDKLKDLVV